MAAVTAYAAASTDRLSTRPAGVLSTGTKLLCVNLTASDTLRFRYSTDSGATWNTATGDLTNVEITTAVGMAPLFVDANDGIWVIYTATTSFDINIRRGTFSGSTITWDSPYTILAGGDGRHFDLTACRISGDDYAACGVSKATSASTHLYIVKRTSGGTYSTHYSHSSESGLSENVAVDFNHTGDGKTISGSAPHLMLSSRDPLSPNGWRVRKYTYSAGPTWSPGTLRSIDTSWNNVAATRPMGSLFDGVNDQFVMAVPETASPYLTVYQRDLADTTTGTLGTVPTGLATSRVTQLFNDPDGNIYVIGVDASSDPQWVKYTRSGASWGSWTVLEAVTVGTAGWDVAALPHPAGLATDLYWIDSATNNIRFDKISYNNPPTAPTWVNTDNVAADVAATLGLDWNFNDPDAGDTQSAYTVRRKLGSGGTWNYWNGTGWQASEDATTKIAASGSILNLASSWGADGDATHYYGVKTWDAADAGPSPWSADLRVIPSGKDNPTITAPTPTGTPTVGATATVTWTVSTQTKYRVVVSDTSSTSNMDAGSLEFDTGVVVDNITSITASFPTNTVTRYVRVQTWNDEGLISNIDEVDVSVSYTPPATPTLVINTDATDKNLDVVITNPGTGATEVDNDVYRRVSGDTGAGIRVATGVAVDGTYTDWLVGSGVVYQYLARCFGDNGSSADSAWTA